MAEITFVTFNYGNAGRYANGPGICLSNFVKDLKKLGVKVNVFSALKSRDPFVKSLNDVKSLYKAVERSDIVHHWSGIYIDLYNLTKISNKFFIGPNLLDGVDLRVESDYLSKTKYNKIFVVNDRIKSKLSMAHSVPLEKIELLQIGPDRDLWSPSNYDDGTILWKGNCTQEIKDVNFALEVAKSLPQYKFKFIGYPKPYEYQLHIEEAKKSHMYFSTSVSETMGLALCESWASGLPSVIHPKIEILGENYKTGIITNKTIKDYSKAITEIMEDTALYNQLKLGALSFIESKFSNVAKDYLKNLED